MKAYYQLPGGRVTALDDRDPFPPLHQALDSPNGLLAIGGTLNPERLIEAYRQGIFPWFNPGDPLLWWSPDPRMVLFPHELRVTASLEKRMRRGDFNIRFDTAFRQVMEACAATPRPGQEGTWIVEDMIDAYCDLHQLGIAFSVETWMDGQLAGGLYGVRIGSMMFGESMFHRVTDASKIAFVHMVRHAREMGIGMIDCQMKTEHLARFGAREIPRADFARRLTELINQPADRQDAFGTLKTA